jgi:hypothetical protein
MREQNLPKASRWEPPPLLQSYPSRPDAHLLLPNRDGHIPVRHVMERQFSFVENNAGQNYA